MATLVPVRVFDCTGSGSLSEDSAAPVRQANAKKPAAVNMSLALAHLRTLDTAVANTVAAGITVGCRGQRLSGRLQLPLARAFRVTRRNDEQHDRLALNRTCPDVFCPGKLDQVSLVHFHNSDQYHQISMVSPHVAGLVALCCCSQSDPRPPLRFPGRSEVASVSDRQTVQFNLLAYTGNSWLADTASITTTHHRQSGLTGSAALSAYWRYR
jgi:hypothetical protein